MSKKSRVKFNVQKLEVLAQGLKKMDDSKFKIQVGIFGDHFARKDQPSNGPTNAEIGCVHEMGSVARRIPRRSFLWDTFTKHFKKAEKEIKDAKLFDKFLLDGKFDQYLKKVGAACKGLVDDAFTTRGFGAWAPNAPATIAAKGSDAPLIDTSQLAQSITYRVVKTG